MSPAGRWTGAIGIAESLETYPVRIMRRPLHSALTVFSCSSLHGAFELFEIPGRWPPGSNPTRTPRCSLRPSARPSSATTHRPKHDSPRNGRRGGLPAVALEHGVEDRF